MVKKLLKQVVGIDVAQKELVVALGHMDENASTQLYASKTFSNNQKGFIALVGWVSKQTEDAFPLRYVMEATGVYHEALAVFLVDKACRVSIVMPNKIANFFKTLEVKTVTDKSMASAIALFGLEKKIEDWVRPPKAFRSLRQLTREKDQLTVERTMLKNQLHAEQAEADPSPAAIDRIRFRIKLINTQLRDIMAETKAIIVADDQINRTIGLITSIPGIGLATAAVIIAETNSFELIRSKKQLTSYAGLDVKEKESGTSVKGKAKISKRGNRYLRKAMYMPALAAIKHSERYKAIFTRIVSKNGIKMKACVAIQRKLLEMAYTIVKNGKPYQKDYLLIQSQNLLNS